METQNKNKKLNNKLKGSELYLTENDFYLKDSDFYPPADNRTFHMYHSKEFMEYASYIYDLYEEEGFYED